MLTPTFSSGCLSLVVALTLAGGHTEFPALLDLDAMTPEQGITVRGQYHYGYLGATVGGGGDYNADGVADFLVGAPGPTSPVTYFFPPNYAYVFYGRPNLAIDELALPGGLDGVDGFDMAGEHLYAQLGYDVGDAGDVNGDGIDDFIIGSPFHRGGDGRAYVVFGRAGLGAGGAFDVTTLDGTNGFVIEALARLDWAGLSVAGVGDLNGDGYDDVAVGAVYSDPPGRPGAGRTYVVFGGPDVGAGGIFDPNVLDGSNGFVVNGVAEGDNAGFQVRGAGDINNDGYADMLIGAIDAAPQGRTEAGQVYVIFGGVDIGAGGVVEPGNVNGANGFLIDGLEPDGHLTYCAVVGDVNDDGIADFAIGSDGPLFVVFGGTEIGAAGFLDLMTLDGRSGFIIPPNTVAWRTRPSTRVDMNHDGIDDLVFGVPAGASHPSGNAVHVCFGHRGLGAGGVFDVGELDGSNGFNASPSRLSGTGWSVKGVGDVNADGVEDLLIGSWAYNTYSYMTQAGRFDVLFGRARFGDFDRDRDVDMADFMDFVMCYNGPLRPPAGSCPDSVRADFDSDGDVDLADYATFSQSYTGAK